MNALKTTAYAAAIVIATLSLGGCDRKAGDTGTAGSTAGKSGDANKSATPPASPASPASK